MGLREHLLKAGGTFEVGPGRQAPAHPAPAVPTPVSRFGKPPCFGPLGNGIKAVKAAKMLDVAFSEAFSGLARG